MSVHTIKQLMEEMSEHDDGQRQENLTESRAAFSHLEKGLDLCLSLEDLDDAAAKTLDQFEKKFEQLRKKIMKASKAAKEETVKEAAEGLAAIYPDVKKFAMGDTDGDDPKPKWILMNQAGEKVAQIDATRFDKGQLTNAGWTQGQAPRNESVEPINEDLGLISVPVVTALILGTATLGSKARPIIQRIKRGKSSEEIQASISKLSTNGSLNTIFDSSQVELLRKVLTNALDDKGYVTKDPNEVAVAKSMSETLRKLGWNIEIVDNGPRSVIRLNDPSGTLRDVGKRF